MAWEAGDDVPVVVTSAMTNVTSVFFRTAAAGAADMRSTVISVTGAHEPAMLDFVRQHGMHRHVAETVDEDGNATCSHYMYGGLYSMGKLRVPQGSATAALADAIVRDFHAGKFAALTENKPAGRPMRMYFDYDFDEPVAPEDAMWDQLERIEKEEVRRFFPATDEERAEGLRLLREAQALPDSDARKDEAVRAAKLAGADGFRPVHDPCFRSMVLASGVAIRENKHGKLSYKAGVHTVYQDLFVTVEMALYIASAVLERVERELPAAHEDAWKLRIDRAVYGKTRGLRWAWQFKAKVCGACCRVTPSGGTTVNRKGCDACYAGMTADVNASMYAPVYYVDGACVRTLIPSCRDAPKRELLLAASIRYVNRDEPTEGFVVYPGAARIPDLKLKHKTKNTVVVDEPGDAEARRAAASRNEAVARHDVRFQAVEAAIKRHHAMYKDVSIRAVVRSSTGRWYRAFVKGKGAGYCQNLGRDHYRATVKFIVKPRGVQQMCLCKCDTAEGRVSKKRCMDYEGPCKPLLDGEKRVLFGRKQDQGFDGDDDMLELLNGSVVKNTATATGRGSRTIEETSCLQSRILARAAQSTKITGKAAAYSAPELMRRTAARLLPRAGDLPFVVTSRPFRREPGRLSFADPLDKALGHCQGADKDDGTQHMRTRALPMSAPVMPSPAMPIDMAL